MRKKVAVLFLAAVLLMNTLLQVSAEEGKSASEPKPPELNYGTVEKYNRSDLSAIKMTNEYLTTDDGNNVTRIIQQSTYDGLFDSKYGSDFQFLWEWEGNFIDGKLPEYVTVPLTIHLELQKGKAVNEVSVFNTDKGKGYMISADAVLKYADGTESEKKNITIGASETKREFAYKWDSKKEVKEVEITVLSVVDNNNIEVKNALTLAEIELRYDNYTPVTAINAEGNKTELTVNEISDIKALFTPEDATNPYFTVASSNPAVAEIITVLGEDGYAAYQVKGVKAGKAVITLTALESADNEVPVTEEYEITVKEIIEEQPVPDVEPEDTTIDKTDKVAPETGDSSMTMIYMMIMAAAAVVIFMKKHKEM